MGKKVVTFGEIMLRLSTPGFLRFHQAQHFEATYGGGEANVAVSLANYGIDVDYVTRLPKNDLGDAVIKNLRKYNVGVDKIIFGGERLGIYFLETGSVARSSKVVYDRAHSAIADIDIDAIDWDQVFEGVDWFHWTGITPAISQKAADIVKKAVYAADAKGITISVDLNYRKNLWNYGRKIEEIMPDLVAKCDVVLGNEEDAEKMLGLKPEGVDVHGGKVNAEAYKGVMQMIMNNFPKVKKVVTTLRGSISASHNSWSGVLYNGKDLIVAPTYQITHIVDRVGGGDSFMGGLIYGLLTFDNDEKALRFAVAASCLKHTIKGDYNLVTVEEVEKIMDGDTSGRVAR